METTTGRAETPETPVNANDPKFGARNIEKLGIGASNSDFTSVSTLQTEMQEMQTSMQTMTQEQRNSYRIAMNDRFTADGYDGHGLPKMEFLNDGSLSITSAQHYDYQNVGQQVRQGKETITFGQDGSVARTNPVAEPVTQAGEKSSTQLSEKPAGPVDGRTEEYWRLTDEAVIESRKAGEHFRNAAFPKYMEQRFADGLANGITTGAINSDMDPDNPFSKGRAVGAKLKELCKSLNASDIQALEQRLSGEFLTSMHRKPGLPLHGN